jgi:hypothetical protein
MGARGPRAPALFASATVSSVLPESMTSRSSAHDTDSRAALTCAASFSVMIAAVTFGTKGVYR